MQDKNIKPKHKIEERIKEYERRWKEYVDGTEKRRLPEQLTM